MGGSGRAGRDGSGAGRLLTSGGLPPLGVGLEARRTSGAPGRLRTWLSTSPAVKAVLEEIQAAAMIAIVASTTATTSAIIAS